MFCNCCLIHLSHRVKNPLASRPYSQNRLQFTIDSLRVQSCGFSHITPHCSDSLRGVCCGLSSSHRSYFRLESISETRLALLLGAFDDRYRRNRTLSLMPLSLILRFAIRCAESCCFYRVKVLQRCCRASPRSADCRRGCQGCGYLPSLCRGKEDRRSALQHNHIEGEMASSGVQ